MKKFNFTFFKEFQLVRNVTSYCFVMIALGTLSTQMVSAQCVPLSPVDLTLDESGLEEEAYSAIRINSLGPVNIANGGDAVTGIEIKPPTMLNAIDDYIVGVDYGACIDAGAGTGIIDFDTAGPYTVRILRSSGTSEYFIYEISTAWHSTCYERGSAVEFPCPTPSKGFVAQDILDSLIAKGIPAGFDSVAVSGVDDLVTKVCAEAGTGTIPLVLDAHGCSGNIFVNGESVSCDEADSTRLKRFLDLKGKVSSVTLLSCSVGYGARGKAFLKKLSKELCVPVTGNTATISSWVRGGQLKWGSYGGTNITLDYKNSIKTKVKDGINNTSFGDATIVETPSNDLVVSNIGSSGEDGVVIDLGGSNGSGASEFFMGADFNSTNLPSGANFGLVGVGSINGLSAEWVHVNFEKPGPSNSMDVNFFMPDGPSFPWDPTQVQVVVTNAGCVEASILLSDMVNPVNLFMDPVLTADPFFFLWNGNFFNGIPDPTFIFSLTFDPRSVLLDGFGPITADGIGLQFLTPPSLTGLELMTQSLVLENRSGFTQTSGGNFTGGPTFNIFEQRLMIPQKPFWWQGLGTAVINPVIDPDPLPPNPRLVVSNIGSSGLDGVSIIVPETQPANALGFCHTPNEETHEDGSAVNFIPFGLINGQPDPGGLGTVSYQFFGGVFQYFVDFFPLNSFQFSVDILNGGVPVGNIPPMPDFFNIGQGNNPIDCSYFILDEFGQLLYDVRFPPGTNMNLFGYNGPADQLIVTPVNPMPVDFITTVNMQCFNSPSSFIIDGYLCDPIFLPIPIKMFPQGFFNGVDLSSAIPALSDFPLAVGDDLIEDPASVLPLIADWVKVKFRDKNDNSRIVKEVNALLGLDGTLLGTDGEPLRVDLPLGAYWVSVCHRNHLEIMTEAFIPFNDPGGVPPLIDFCSAQSFLNGSIFEGGFFVAPSGDYNGDGAINAVDKNAEWSPQNGQPSTYGNTADGNGDGTVNAVDKNAEWSPNNGMQTQVPTGN
ncbi:MAG: hypothetical protein AAF502_00785 [Bacteroidota bacterium]